MNGTLRRLLTTGALFLLASAAAAEDEVFVTDSAAIRGHDPVAYFTEGRPVPGDAEIRHEWSGATWLFSSRENRDRFAADPERYAPQFGGFCAYGLSRGYKVGTDPAAFTIHNDKLYLNYSLAVRATWLQDTDTYIRKGVDNWQTLEHAPHEP